MVLSAILKLDAGAFTTPLGKAVEGIKATIRVAGELNEKLTAAFDLGGQLSDLQAQTGEMPGTLMVLRQAFEDTGVGADALRQNLAFMRRALGGISETGEPTSKIFRQLGLDMDALKNMGAQDQLAAVGEAIRGLRTPAEQSAAAMQIFGRGGVSMLTFLKDTSAMDTAARSLGGLPALMDRNAAAFDAVSDAIGRIKGKSAGLWAGIAEGLLPMADQITGALDNIDLTGLGQKIGNAIGTLVQLFKDAPLGQTIRDAFTVGIGQGINWAVTGFVSLGAALWKALSTPLSYFSAAIGKTIQEAMELIGRIPKIGKMAGLDGFQAQTFAEIRQQAKDDLVSMVDLAGSIGKLQLVDTTAAQARLKESWQAAAQEYAQSIDKVQKKAVLAAPAAFGSEELEPTKAKKPLEGISLADSLTRIGGYLGGGASYQNRLAALSERTARATERIAQQMGFGNLQPAWGN